MNATLIGVHIANPNNQSSNHSDLGFLFNILVPDLMLFTISASLVFAILIYAFH